MEYGWLTGGADWRVSVAGADAFAAAGVADALNMMAALDELYGTVTAPPDSRPDQAPGDACAATAPSPQTPQAPPADQSDPPARVE